MPTFFSRQIPGITAEETNPTTEFSMPSRHIHDSLELYFLLEGERYYFVEQDTFYLQKGMAILINSGQMHKTSTVPGCAAHRRFLLQLDPSILNPIFRFPDCPDLNEFGDRYWGAVEFDPEVWTQILTIIERLKQELVSAPVRTGRRKKQTVIPTVPAATSDTVFIFSEEPSVETSKESSLSIREASEFPLPSGYTYPNSASYGHLTPESSALGRLLAMELVFLFMRGRRSDTFHTTQDAPGIYGKVHEIALYLQNHSADPGSLDEIAAHFYISRPYLTRIFKSVTGFTVVEYLTVCRIRKAKTLLTETDMGITEIADCTGFGNITYFERVFKKMTEFTPLQYRKETRRI